MKTTFAVLASVAAVAVAAPEGCSSSAPAPFTITVNNSTGTAKRSLEQRQNAQVLTLTLADGILKDQQGRIAYIADNYQFQFDNPVQDTALSADGYSICGNNSLALGETTVFWQCNSGDINNLYDRDWAPQCIPVHLNRREGANNNPVSQIPDGQPQATEAVSQIPDGQPQAPTAGPAVTQIPDGQPQAPAPGAPVTQIPDGQPQAPQPGAPVTQIPDGQPQAPAPGAPVTQIPDGQPQAPAPGAPVTQIPDGQPQAPNATVALPSPSQFTGAAAYATPFIGAFAAGVVGVVALL